jgi:hydroxyethylthiazole kinase-like uncharacterized protein yjeF
MAGDPEQILTVAQMVAAEQALIEGGSSVDELMQVAGHGAGELVWRISARRPVTVLCGPGNNGGDGYVIAELIRSRGVDVAVIAAREPGTDAARHARSLFAGPVLSPGAERHGEVFVDCLFGSGLSRGLPDDLMGELARLARSHDCTVAVDLPSGVESDSGALLNAGLPFYDVTIALGAWKFAHWIMPAAERMGARRLVDIGAASDGGARLLARPDLAGPAADSHKYTRGLLAVVGGAMPGAALLACAAAQRSGAGYVKLLTDVRAASPPELVIDDRPLPEALADPRIAAVLVGPGLGRDETARSRLAAVLGARRSAVIDADALLLLLPQHAPLEAVLTPHEGELAALERNFALAGQGSRRERALALAQATGAVVLLKGPDSLIAAPDGRLILAPCGSSWLSTAGTGDVLAGIIASRLATGANPFAAAREGLWLHGEAARLTGAAFTAGELAEAVRPAFSAALR